MVADYITIDDARTHAGIDDTLDDATLQAAITTISRKIDAHCKRHFYTTNETRYFTPTWWGFVYVDDISTASGLVVKTDDNDDGTHETTWTVTTDFQLLPVNRTVGGIPDYPFTKLAAVGSRTFPTCNVRTGPVLVTATFGWSSVPEQVEASTRVLVKWLWKVTKDAALGVAGFPEFGAAMRVRDNPVAVSLLAPFVSDPVMVG